MALQRENKLREGGIVDYTFEELKEKTVAQLREIAEGLDHDALHGYKTMHKEQLVLALCKALGIAARKQRKVVGINKAEIKKQIRELKVERDAALEAHDHKRLKEIRRRIHRLKRTIRKGIA